MANKFEIPEEVERRIRHRDKTCVYCHKKMTHPYRGGKQRDWATIEHLNEKPPFYWNDGLEEGGIAICCGSCNSSRGKKKLLRWFQTPYCIEKNINEKTVARPVRDYVRQHEGRKK